MATEFNDRALTRCVMNLSNTFIPKFLFLSFCWGSFKFCRRLVFLGHKLKNTVAALFFFYQCSITALSINFVLVSSFYLENKFSSLFSLYIFQVVFHGQGQLWFVLCWMHILLCDGWSLHVFPWSWASQLTVF